MKKKLHILSLVLPFVLILSCPILTQGAEELTITTYYPSPYGSYRDLAISNSLTVGPINGSAIWPGATAGSIASVPGAVAVSGGGAMLAFIDRNAAGYSATTAGNTFAWYNSGLTARFYTTVHGDLWTIAANGQVNFSSKFDNDDANPGTRFYDSNGWGTLQVGTIIYCND